MLHAGDMHRRLIWRDVILMDSVVAAEREQSSRRTIVGDGSYTVSRRDSFEGHLLSSDIPRTHFAEGN